MSIKNRILCLLGFHDDYPAGVRIYDFANKYPLTPRLIIFCSRCHRVKWADKRLQAKFHDEMLHRGTM